MNSILNALTIKDRNFIFLVIGGVLFLNIIPMPLLSPILILLFGVILGFLIISIFAPEDFNFLLNIYLIGFFVRTFLSFFFYILSFVFKSDYSPGFLFSDDGWCYSMQGWQIYKFAERGIIVTRETFLYNSNFLSMSGNLTAYDYFTSFIYSFTGYSPLSLFFISSLAGSLAALFTYLITKELFSKNVARISSIFAFFWPSFIMWSTQNLKEPMIAMCVCILVWTIFYMYRSSSPGFLLLSIMPIWALFKIGFPYIVIVLCMILFTGLFLFMEHLFKNKFISITIIGLFFFALIYFSMDQILAQIFKDSLYNVKNFDSIFELLNFHRNLRAFGRLQFLKGIDVSSIGKAMAFAPLGLIYAIFAPFPWQVGSVTQILVLPETIIYYILVPCTLKGIVFAFKKRFNQSLMLLSIIAGILLVLSLVEGNVGTLFRHRSVAFNLLFIFTAIGISLKKKRKNLV